MKQLCAMAPGLQELCGPRRAAQGSDGAAALVLPCLEGPWICLVKYT